MKKLGLLLPFLLMGCGGDSNSVDSGDLSGELPQGAIAAEEVFDNSILVTDPNTGVTYTEVTVKEDTTVEIVTTNNQPFTIATSADAPQRLAVKGNLTVSAQ